MLKLQPCIPDEHHVIPGLLVFTPAHGHLVRVSENPLHKHTRPSHPKMTFHLTEKQHQNAYKRRIPRLLQLDFVNNLVCSCHLDDFFHHFYKPLILEGTRDTAFSCPAVLAETATRLSRETLNNSLLLPLLYKHLLTPCHWVSKDTSNLLPLRS